MKETIRKKLQETKSELILDAVSDYFDRAGYSQPTMQEIARELGISVGALYKLFPSKDALFFAYVRHQIQRFHRELLERSASLSSPEERLILYVHLKFETFSSKRKAIEDPVLGDPLFFLKMNTRRENPAEPIYRYLAEAFGELHRTTPLRSDNHLKTAFLFNGHTMSYIEYWIHFGDRLEESAREVFEIFLRGMAR